MIGFIPKAPASSQLATMNDEGKNNDTVTDRTKDSVKKWQSGRF